MKANIFLSYSSRDAEMPEFTALRSDLEGWERSYWYDRGLKGGLPWWTEIVERIASSEIFLLVLTKHSLKSDACRRELGWALTLHRHVLPVRLEVLPDRAIPSELATIEFLDYSMRKKDPDAASRCASRLGMALAAADNLAPQPLPDPMPRPPDPPKSYADVLNRYLQAPPDSLTPHDQRALVTEARTMVTSDDDDQSTLSDALIALRTRHDLTYDTREEVDALIERLTSTRSGDVKESEEGEPQRWKVKNFAAPRVDLWKVGKHLAAWYETQKMTTSVEVLPSGECVVTCHSESASRLIGAGARLKVVLSKSGDQLTVKVGGAGWKDKVASAGVGVAATFATGGAGIVLLAPSAVGSYKQARLPGRTLRYLEETLPLCNRD